MNKKDIATSFLRLASRFWLLASGRWLNEFCPMGGSEHRTMRYALCALREPPAG
jgi:hypothetical protein